MRRAQHHKLDFKPRLFIVGLSNQEECAMKSKSFALPVAVLGAALLLMSCGQKQQQISSNPNPPILVVPGVSVGKVHAGMTLDQVRAELGEPQRTTPNALEYTSLGFAVMPGPDGVVQVVMCGDVVGNNGPLVKNFNGRTKEGIGLGSTREEVTKAYGEPSNDEKFPGARESMRYDPLGMTFSTENGTVHHMIVRLKSNQAQNRTIEITP
jgi:hypothetical protein